MLIFCLNYLAKRGSLPFLEEVTADLEPASSEPDFITASRLDKTLITVCEWVQVGSAPAWSDCAGLSPELRSWQLQFRNLSVDSDDRLWCWILDMSVTTSEGNRYVLVMVDCFSQWTEACPLPNKTALAVADAFFQMIVCRFGMPAVIHSDQGREFENNMMQELCPLGGSHKTRTTPYLPASDGLVVRFNRTLLMMLAMFAGDQRDDWDDLLPAVMMAYRSSVHESTGFSPYSLMFGEECPFPMDVGLPRRTHDITVQLHPDSLVLLIHCQDLKKIQQLKGLVSWLPSDKSTSSAARPVLGASMVCRSPLGSASSTVPDSRHCRSCPRTPQPQTQVSEAPASLARRVDSTLVPRIADMHVLHPFFHHRLDVGPLHLTSITHAFNYRILVLQDGVKLLARVGRSRRAAR